MMTWLRRVFLISVLSGGGYAAWSLYQRRQLEPAAPPEWPPIDPPATATGESAASVSPASEPELASSVPTDSNWVEPSADGSCPLTHPVKANANSGIFHVPEGRSYARTKAERCYADPAAASADGFRAAKA